MKEKMNPKFMKAVGKNLDRRNSFFLLWVIDQIPHKLVQLFIDRMFAILEGSDK
jgi:hypothetical protein